MNAYIWSISNLVLEITFLSIAISVDNHLVNTDIPQLWFCEKYEPVEIDSIYNLQWFFKMSASVYRSQVLSLYRQILRLARSWTSVSGQSDKTQEEKNYISEEAKRLFRNNKEVSRNISCMFFFLWYFFGGWLLIHKASEHWKLWHWENVYE